MAAFTDTKSRAWTIRITHATRVKVIDALQIDLYKLVEDKGKPLGKLLQDHFQLVGLVWFLVRDQASDVTELDFAEGLAGDAIEQMGDAFVEALTDFFPNARVRASLTKALQATKSLATKVVDKAIAEVDSLDLEAMAAQVFADLKVKAGLPEKAPASPPAKSSESSGDAPASPASTPTPAASGN